MSTLGEKILKLRKKLGMTREQLCRGSDISTSYLSQIESGKVTPSHRKIKAISYSLGVPAKQLVAEGDYCKFKKAEMFNQLLELDAKEIRIIQIIIDVLRAEKAAYV